MLPPPERLVARTRRLVVRPFEPTDYRAWRAANAARLPQQHRFDSPPRHPEHLTPTAFRKMVADGRRLARTDRMYIFGLFERRGGELVGTVTLMVVMRMVSQLAWVGYGIYNHQWHKGYGKEGLRAVLDLAFRKLALHRVEAGIEPRNRASIALARSVEMRREGAPRRAVWIDGRWRDLVVYAASAEDYRIKTRPSFLVNTAELSRWVTGGWRSGGESRSKRRAPKGKSARSRAGSR